MTYLEQLEENGYAFPAGGLGREQQEALRR